MSVKNDEYRYWVGVRAFKDDTMAELIQNARTKDEAYSIVWFILEHPSLIFVHKSEKPYSACIWERTGNKNELVREELFSVSQQWAKGGTIIRDDFAEPPITITSKAPETYYVWIGKDGYKGGFNIAVFETREETETFIEGLKKLLATIHSTRNRCIPIYSPEAGEEDRGTYDLSNITSIWYTSYNESLTFVKRWDVWEDN